MNVKRIYGMRTIAADIVLNVLLLIAAYDKEKDGRVVRDLLAHLKKRTLELLTRIEELE
jgi:hypothetical protein